MAKIHYAHVDEFWRREQKYVLLYEKQGIENVEWQELQPDGRQTWITQGMHDEFAGYISIGDKETKSSETLSHQSIFKTFSNGVKTNRDVWAYNFDKISLANNIRKTIDVYNDHLHRWQRAKNESPNIDEFVTNDDKQISWSEELKHRLMRGKALIFSPEKVRFAGYRPYTKTYLFFDKGLNERVYGFSLIFPTLDAESENHIICASGLGHDVFRCLISNAIVEFKFSNSANGGTQCFPFYTYTEDGTNRRENITDWALEQFRSHYNDPAITKWNIFHYVYAILHHPIYRERYAANLKRELPRIPFAPDFRGFAEAGARLAELHVHYELQPEYPLEKIDTPGERLNWRVEKMKLSKDKTQIVYNKSLMLDGIPPETFEYRLGNRSALEWVIDQYQVSTDKRSGITNDPNREDDPQYIVRLVGQIITVSLETMKIVNSLPDLGLDQAG